MNPIFDISTRNMDGKTILEVGSGRGDTTRLLVDFTKSHVGAQLVATDLSDAHFSSFAEEFKSLDVRFLCTAACSLDGVENDSVDFLACNYTLCAVEAQTGAAFQALTRFHEVPIPGGELFIEEEYPINFAAAHAQQVWAEKWRILKAALLIACERPFHEFAPEDLEILPSKVGFTGIVWEKDASLFGGANTLEFFQIRLDPLMQPFPHETIRTGFGEWAAVFDEKAKAAGGMEIPYYRLHAFREMNP